MSNDYWSAFDRADVDLVTDGIERLDIRRLGGRPSSDAWSRGLKTFWAHGRRLSAAVLPARAQHGPIHTLDDIAVNLAVDVHRVSKAAMEALTWTKAPGDSCQDARVAGFVDS